MLDHIKILVAGDDDASRQAWTQALHQRYRGAIIQEATSCSEASEAMLSKTFDCVILDESLRDGDGVSCLFSVRKAGIGTPVILLSENGDDIEALEQNDAGATITVPKKDLSLPLLESCFSSALRFYKAEQQIRQVEDELRLKERAISAASNGIMICDPHQPDCPIVYCNPAFTTITGYSSEEVMGHNCRFLQGKETDDRYIQQVRDCLRSERDCQIILRNYKKDGTPFWNELTISPVRDAEGKLTHYIGVQTDITERRNAEDALLQNVKRQQTLLRDVFANATEGRLRLCISEDDLPTPLNRFFQPIPLAADNGVRSLRQQTVKACLAVGIPSERCDDLETAVGEAGMNAIVHSGTGTGHVFTHDRGTVQVRVTDEGKGIDVADLPNATLRRGFSTAGTMGHGFKMMLKIVDRVHLLTGSAGTTVVIEQDRLATAPTW